MSSSQRYGNGPGRSGHSPTRLSTPCPTQRSRGVRTDGRRHVFHSHQVYVANGGFHAGRPITGDANADDRLLVAYPVGGPSRWHLLREMDQHPPDVALAFGPHTPRPGASHMIEAEMERHFAVWGDGRRVDVQRLERTPEELAAYRAFPGRYTFFSDVNGCVARWAWRRIPYRAVPYAEDQLLGREMIEAGLAKVFHPGARVLHSHDYPPAQFLRRYFDEFRSLREVLDHVEPAHPLNTPRTVRSLARNDERWLRERKPQDFAAHIREAASALEALASSSKRPPTKRVPRPGA